MRPQRAQPLPCSKHQALLCCNRANFIGPILVCRAGEQFAHCLALADLLWLAWSIGRMGRRFSNRQTTKFKTTTNEVTPMDATTKWQPARKRERYRQEHPCDAASAQHRRGRRHRQARQLRRAHLEQPRQVQVRRRHVSDQRPPRDDLGREVLQGFQRPSRQARPCAGAGAGALRRAGDPRCGRRRRAQRDHRHLRLQRTCRTRRASGSPSN